MKLITRIHARFGGTQFGNSTISEKGDASPVSQWKYG